MDPLRFGSRARAVAAYHQRRMGGSIAQIASKLDVSKQRASALVDNGREIVQGIAGGDPTWELSPRSRNALVLWGEGITPAEVAKLDLKLVANLGVKSQQEIREWLARHAQAV
jgi:hypothetical protein